MAFTWRGILLLVFVGSFIGSTFLSLLLFDELAAGGYYTADGTNAVRHSVIPRGGSMALRASALTNSAAATPAAAQTNTSPPASGTAGSSSSSGSSGSSSAGSDSGATVSLSKLVSKRVNEFTAWIVPLLVDEAANGTNSDTAATPTAATVLQPVKSAKPARAPARHALGELDRASKAYTAVYSGSLGSTPAPAAAVTGEAPEATAGAAPNARFVVTIVHPHVSASTQTQPAAADEPVPSPPAIPVGLQARGVVERYSRAAVPFFSRSTPGSGGGVDAPSTAFEMDDGTGIAVVGNGDADDLNDDTSEDWKLEYSNALPGTVLVSTCQHSQPNRHTEEHGALKSATDDVLILNRFDTRNARASRRTGSRSSAYADSDEWCVVAYEHARPIVDTSLPFNESVVGFDAGYWLRVYRFPSAVRAANSGARVVYEDMRVPGSMPITAVAIDHDTESAFASADASHPHEIPSDHKRVYYAVERDTHVFRTLSVQLDTASAEPQRMRITLSAPGPIRERRSKITKTAALLPYWNTGKERFYVDGDAVATTQRDPLIVSVEFLFDAHALIASFHSQIVGLYRGGSGNAVGSRQWRVMETVTKGYSRKKEHGTLQYKNAAPDSIANGLTVGASLHADTLILTTSPYMLTIDGEYQFQPLEIINLDSSMAFTFAALNPSGTVLAIVDNRNDVILLERNTKSHAAAETGASSDEALMWRVYKEIRMPERFQHLHLMSVELIDREEATYLLALFESGVIATFDINASYYASAAGGGSGSSSGGGGSSNDVFSDFDFSYVRHWEQLIFLFSTAAILLCSVRPRINIAWQQQRQQQPAQPQPQAQPQQQPAMPPIFRFIPQPPLPPPPPPAAAAAVAASASNASAPGSTPSSDDSLRRRITPSAIDPTSTATGAGPIRPLIPPTQPPNARDPD